MLKITLILLSSLYILSNGQQVSLELSIESKEEQCLSEYYKSETVNVVSIYGDMEIQMDIYNPDGESLYSNITEMHQFSFISENDGYYEFCLTNQNDGNITSTIIIKTGIAAKDFSSLAKTRDFKKSEIEIEKIIERKKNIQHFYHRSYNHDIHFEISIQQLTKRIITCSFIIIFVMILIGGVETYYLKKFMERRKII